MSSAETIAVRTSTFFANAGTLSELRFREIIGIDNTFSGVGNVLTGSGHGGFLLDESLDGGRVQIISKRVKGNSPTLFTQSPFLQRSGTLFFEFCFGI
jgi:hypothetical protein